MLETFAKHLKLSQEVFRDGVPGWEEVTKPENLARMLVFSFLEDIECALTFSPFQIEIHGVGILRRMEGEIYFSPHPLLLHEAATEQLLLDGAFWKILCGAETDEKTFLVPLRLHKNFIGSITHLRAVGECMLMTIQRHESFEVLSHTLWRGLCLAVHDAICGGLGIKLEGVGTFSHACQFTPDSSLLEKIKGKFGESDCEGQFSLGWPASRRQTNNRGWGQGSGG